GKRRYTRHPFIRHPFVTGVSYGRPWKSKHDFSILDSLSRGYKARVRCWPGRVLSAPVRNSAGAATSDLRQIKSFTEAIERHPPDRLGSSSTPGCRSFSGECKHRKRLEGEGKVAWMK